MSRFARLSLEDLTLFGFERPETPMHIGAVAMLETGPLLTPDGRLDIDRIRSRLRLRLQRAPQLLKVLRDPGFLAGRTLWVDSPRFDLAEHVRQIEVAPPGGEEDMLKVAARLLEPPLDRSRPLWEMWFLTGLAEGRIALLIKLHHSIADGLAAVHLLGQLFDLEPDAPDPAAESWVPAPPPRWRELALDSVGGKVTALGRTIGRLAHPLAVARAMAAGGRGAVRTAATAWGAPQTSLNAPIGQERRLAVIHLRLNEVKAVAHAHGGKVNDVVLELIAGGLRGLLQSRGQPVSGVTARASVMVAGRSAADAAELGNKAGVISVPLRLDEKSAAAGLEAIAGVTRQEKAVQQGAFVRWLMVGMARSGIAQSYFRRQRLATVFETNVPGPPVPLYFLGARILDLMAVGGMPYGNVTLTFAAVSYAGALNLSIGADSASNPDLPILARAMEDTWRELNAELVEPLRPGSAGFIRPAAEGPNVAYVGAHIDSGLERTN